MPSTIEKIVIAVIVVIFVGFNALFIMGQDNSIVQKDDSAATEKTIPTKQQSITKEQAKSIALSVANGVITELKEKTRNGITYYEVELESGTTEIELKIDKKTGDILQIQREEKDKKEDEEVSPAELKSITNILTEAEAKAIALELIPGTITGFKAERENGRLIYEVEIAAQNDIAEVEIDAETGNILEIEWGEE